MVGTLLIGLDRTVVNLAVPKIISDFGEEPMARRIARAIAAARPLQTKTQLADVIRSVKRVKAHDIDPATRTFQALRIALNGALGAIERGLDAAIRRTRPGGRIVAISFHTLEDRIVKHRFRSDERVDALTKKPVVPSVDEIVRKPPARSAKLRIAERRP